MNDRIPQHKQTTEEKQLGAQQDIKQTEKDTRAKHEWVVIINY
jgi:hypothetical protein